LHLSPSDLRQLDPEQLLRLPPEQKDVLLCKLLSDLQAAHERLQANSHHSSRPPRSDPPWSAPRAGQGPAEDVTPAPGEDDEAEASAEPEVASGGNAAESSASEPTPGPGRRQGAPGYSRQVRLAISDPLLHWPEQCVVCGQALERAAFIARTGLYVLDIETEPSAGLGGLRVRHDKHLYGEITCPCGHCNRREPGRCAEEPLWGVALSEWHRVGPGLASLIVCLAHRLHLSRRRSQEFLRDWLHIELSTSTLTHCLHEAGRAVEPLEEQLVEELQQAPLAYGDETSGKEWGERLWLWVISTSRLCLYFIGYRSQEILDNGFEQRFAGWLMSDG
jgi:transposase